MKIIQKVTLKQVLTVRSKEKLLQYYSEQRQKLQKESDQLHFEQKKMERRNKFNQESVNNYFAKEIEMRYEKVKLIEFQVEQLDILPLGSEIKEQELDAILDVAVGDTWDDSMFTKTILVKDNIIVEIR
ncbi:YlqD family protein [Listeria rocourtiae]|uniref:YlqD family protein n=1 Tax=Listeria rocourtiae TaxID=647910 RepID=UPI003D2F7EF4